MADLSPADRGRKEIDIADQEMPGLMPIRRKYATASPLKGVQGPQRTEPSPGLQPPVL